LKPLVESVPNFSAGRRREVVEAIVAAMRAVPEVHILDVHTDVDHNRTVVTLVGPPPAVLEADFRAIAQAAALINLDEHQGAHPRLGATDVVPFVPLSGVTLAECVALAQELGRRVGAELGIPVYLYEAAATRPDRVALEDVRRGQYEALKTEILTNPDRAPDFGPARVGPAGATIIGARPFLIAFNVYLNTDRVELAEQIAKAIRGSNGGWRYAKALGLLVAGQAQVSLNLTDFTQTPPHRVLEAIRREAAHYGLTVTHTELVGLIPEATLVDAARWYLQLERLEAEQIVERRLAALDETAPWGFVEAVAAGTPAPGGGAVAALAGALAGALAAMVARLTAGKRSYAAVAAEMGALTGQAEVLRAALLARVDEDAAAYTAVLAARRLPQSTPEERSHRDVALQAALTQATEIPLATARDALAVLELLKAVAQTGLRSAVGDAATGAWLAHAAVQSAALTARLNFPAVADPARCEGWAAEAARLVAQAEALLAQIQAVVAERTGMVPAAGSPLPTA